METLMVVVTFFGTKSISNYTSSEHLKLTSFDKLCNRDALEQATYKMSTGVAELSIPEN